MITRKKNAIAHRRRDGSSTLFKLSGSTETLQYKINCTACSYLTALSVTTGSAALLSSGAGVYYYYLNTSCHAVRYGCVFIVLILVWDSKILGDDSFIFFFVEKMLVISSKLKRIIKIYNCKFLFYYVNTLLQDITLVLLCHLNANKKKKNTFDVTLKSNLNKKLSFEI